MKPSAFLTLAFVTLCPLAVHADIKAVATATPATVTVKPLSTPAVTPDPRFVNKEYAGKWPHISLEESQRLHAMKDVVFVDGRALQEWKDGHIPGAVALPIGEFDKRYDSHKKKLKRARILVSYCHGEGCRLSDMLAQKLVDKGHRNVAVFWGGFPAWDGAKLPLVNEKGEPIVRPTAVPVDNASLTYTAK